MGPKPDWRFEPTVTAPGKVERVGQYDLIEPLGRGGMGVVWRGVHRHLGQTVAIKFLAPDSWSDPQAVARFYREMRAVGRVVHPNLVRALDAGEYDGHHVLVMECVEGLTVRDLLAATGPLSVETATEIIRQAALGLSAIAAAGMVHRDLKPSNLFLTTGGIVKILDLGLARFQVDGDDRDLTISGDLLGTVDYMAPEQSQDPRGVDARSDLYSLGCTLYALLTGGAPFVGQHRSSLEARLRAHREEAPPPIDAVRPDLPRALCDLIARLLAKRPEDRVDSADQLASSLTAFSSAESLAALAKSRSPAPSGQAGNPYRRGDSSRPVMSSAVETSEVPVSPDAKTPLTQKLSGSPPPAARNRGIRIAAAVGLLAVVTLILLSLQHGRGRPQSLLEPVGESRGGKPADPGPALVPLVPPRPALHDLSHAARLEWHDLLGHRPVPVYWQAGEGLAHWDWQEKQGQLIVSNNDRGLLFLGRLDEEDYMLQVGIHQNGWSGGVGIFVGLDDWDSERGVPGWHCSELMIYQVADPKGRRKNRIDFSRLESAAGANRRVTFEETAEASETVRGPAGEAMLELTVKRGRLVKIQFDGAELRNILESISEIKPQVKWSGGLGVCVLGGDATIRKARLMILDEGR